MLKKLKALSAENLIHFILEISSNFMCLKEKKKIDLKSSIAKFLCLYIIKYSLKYLLFNHKKLDS